MNVKHFHGAFETFIKERTQARTKNVCAVMFLTCYDFKTILMSQAIKHISRTVHGGEGLVMNADHVSFPSQFP